MTVADDARSLVARTTAAQGLPMVVSEPAVLAKVGAILSGAILSAAKGNAGPHHKADVTNIFTSAATSWKKGGQRDGT